MTSQIPVMVSSKVRHSHWSELNVHFFVLIVLGCKYLQSFILGNVLIRNYRSISTFYIMHDSRHTSKTHANLFNRLSFSPFASLNSFRACSASVQKKTAYHYIN